MPNFRIMLATKNHKGHKRIHVIASVLLSVASTRRKKVRNRQAAPTYSASNPVVQPRSGDITLALGERGESREPSVTRGQKRDGFGGEGLCGHFIVSIRTATSVTADIDSSMVLLTSQVTIEWAALSFVVPN